MSHDMSHSRLAALVLALGWLTQAGAQGAAQAVDRDSDGLIEINNLDDLNEIRNDLTGRTLRGSSVGCPGSGCFGYELTRDLDFDSNGNGIRDAEDWNAGRPWTPIQGTKTNVPLDENRFRAVLDGNGHAIRNMMVRRITNVTDYGLFGSVVLADIRGLRLTNVDVNIRGGVSNHQVGALAGRVLNRSWVVGITVDGNVISDSQNALAGLIGMIFDSRVYQCGFSGQVAHLGTPIENDPNPDVAGLVGYAANSLIAGSHARGHVSGAYVAGLVETTTATGISSSFSNVELRARVQGAGLVNRAHYGKAGVPADILTNPAYFTIADVYALGSIVTGSAGGGGLIANLNLRDGVTFKLENAYAKNLITGGTQTTQWANLIQTLNGNGLVVEDSYWVKDPAGAILPSNSDLVLGGQLLADMQCASSNTNQSCAAPLLFKNWTLGAWDYGAAAELPAVNQTVSHRWLSRDTPNASGDHEALSKLRSDFPQDTCENPLSVYAKEKNSAYVFHSERNEEVLETFSGTQGLICKNTSQVDGACVDYRVRYLCGDTIANGSGRWTAWSNRDAPTSGDGDDERIPSGSVCATGAPLGIEASSADGQNFRRGPPRKLKTFGASKGLVCLNSDGTCKDYQVRMLCWAPGDR